MQSVSNRNYPKYLVPFLRILAGGAVTAKAADVHEGVFARGPADGFHCRVHEAARLD
jgi:hypothetical protein